MSDVIIAVENLGKKYRLRNGNSRSYASLRDVIVGFFRAQTFANRVNGTSQKAADYFWALDDVSFEIGRGEVVGVIGSNGAGKSTLLKILSQITEPTKGRVVLGGRIASLLEVGTGFHPELTGRENVFLNGAILGMRREEIKKRFDEIVAFAEVEKFLDTPVKHYSSGMYVRLAFAVAAHMDPEILVVDEVLAVGDIEFQKKCIGKMQDVAQKSGRTVLFVSHNMAAISALTARTIYLSQGRLVEFDATSAVVRSYHNSLRTQNERQMFQGRGNHTRLLSAVLIDADGTVLEAYVPGDGIRLLVEFETDGTPSMSIEMILIDPNEQRLGLSSLFQYYGMTLPTVPGSYRYEVAFSPLWLAAGRYAIDITTSVANVDWDHYVNHAVEFDVFYSNPAQGVWDFRHSLGFGCLALHSQEVPKFEEVTRN